MYTTIGRESIVAGVRVMATQTFLIESLSGHAEKDATVPSPLDLWFPAVDGGRDAPADFLQFVFAHLLFFFGQFLDLNFHLLFLRFLFACHRVSPLCEEKGLGNVGEKRLQ